MSSLLGALSIIFCSSLTSRDLLPQNNEDYNERMTELLCPGPTPGYIKGKSLIQFPMGKLHLSLRYVTLRYTDCVINTNNG
jgi:hypothetical protein